MNHGYLYNAINNGIAAHKYRSGYAFQIVGAILKKISALLFMTYLYDLIIIWWQDWVRQTQC